MECISGDTFSNLHDSENEVIRSLWSSGLSVLPNVDLFAFGMRCLCVESIQFAGLQPSCAHDRVRAEN